MMEKIDTHCHVVPRIWRQRCVEYGYDRPDGMPAIPVSYSPDFLLKPD